MEDQKKNNQKKNSQNKKGSGGAKAGGAVLLLLLIIAAVLFYLKPWEEKNPAGGGGSQTTGSVSTEGGSDTSDLTEGDIPTEETDPQGSSEKTTGTSATEGSSRASTEAAGVTTEAAGATTEATEASSTEEYKTYAFRSKKLLDQHYEKHGIEMGFPDTDSYVAAANDVINDPATLHKTEAEDGDDVYYRESDNAFVVVSTDGYIRTFFYPNGGKSYYDRQ